MVHVQVHILFHHHLNFVVVDLSNDLFEYHYHKVEVVKIELNLLALWIVVDIVLKFHLNIFQVIVFVVQLILHYVDVIKLYVVNEEQIYLMINVYVILQIHDNDDQLYEMYDLNHHVQLFDKPILKKKKDKRRRRKYFTVYFSSLFDRSIVRVLSIDTVIGIDIIFKIVSYNINFISR